MMIRVELSKRLTSATGAMTLDVAFDVNAGDFVTLYGPSGAGKTSVLRMICGLMQPDKGRLEVKGKMWFDSQGKRNVKPRDRAVGVVFQDYALFPNMTVEENLRFAQNKGGDQAFLDHLIEIIDLEQLRDRKPTTLSGGQKQRVALARALARKPEILLLDEPLSALDRAMRRKLQDYLAKVHSDLGLTTLLVSHDISEIVRLSNKVVAIRDGRIDYLGTPAGYFYENLISGKVQLSGEIIDIVKRDVVYVVSVLCGNDLVKVVIADPEKQDLAPGDNVLVVSKAFNPVIQKIKD